MDESLKAQLQATLDMIPAFTWLAAPSGAITFVNSRCADYLGLPQDHPLRFGIDTGAAWDSHIPFLHPDDHEEMRRVGSDNLRTGRTAEASCRIRDAQGNYRWFLSRTETLRGNNGTILYWIGINIDIDERKQAEAELRRSKEYLADAERLSRTGFVGMEGSTKRLFWSEEAARIYGYPPGTEPTPDLILKRSHPDDLGLVTDALERAAQGGNDFDYEHRLLMPDGSIKHLHDLAHRVRDEAGNNDVVGAIVDITERKVAEEAIRRSEAYLAEAQTLSHTGSFGWKVSSGEIFWSVETFRIFECDSGTKPTVELVLSRVYPDDRSVVQQQIDRASRDRAGFDFEHRLQLPDGSVKHVRVTTHPSRDNVGNFEFVGAITDITQQRRAEAVIRTQEAELRDVVDTIPAIVWSALPDGSNAYVNSRFVEYCGMPPEQIAGTGWHAATHPDDLERHNAKWLACVASGDPCEDELRFRRADGEYRWHLVRGVPLRDEASNIVKWYGVVTDIEDRKRAEESLRSSEAYLAEAQRLSQTGSWAWSPDQDIRYWSEECYRVLSFDPQDGLPRFEEFFQRIHPDDQPGFRELIQTAIREKAEWEADYRIVHPGGAIRDIHVVGHPVLSTSGHLLEFVGTVIDVTERKRAEEERRRSEMELREMLDLAPQHIAVYGPNRERLYLNRVSLTYIGLSLEEWQQSSRRGNYIHPDDNGRLDGVFGHVVARGSADELELRLRRRDGTYCWFLARFKPLRDELGQITRWYVASTDIEDRKQAEDRLRSENVALREEIDKASMFEEIVGTSPVLKSVLSRISKVAPSDSTVLVTGETGTGKELVARAIHRRSDRASRAFVSVNCAAIPVILSLLSCSAMKRGPLRARLSSAWAGLSWQMEARFFSTK